MRLVVLLAGLVVLSIAPASTPLFSSPAEHQSLLYTVAPKYSPSAWLQGGERFPAGARIVIADARQPRSLVARFFASADPNVSFDGTRILFAGKEHPRDPWQIWEVLPDGSNLRPVTSCATDCVRPFYLPEDRLVYARKVAGRFVIEAAPLRGGAALALTYAASSALPSDVLRDGRILFASAYPLGGRAVPELYTVYSDGSGVESYRCDHGSARFSGRQLASGDIVFARSKGQGRFTSALAHEVEVPSPRGEYAGDLAEASTGDLLFSRRSDAQHRFQLVRWTPGTNRVIPVIAESAADVVQPVLLSPRAVPDRHPSALHDWNYANLLCLNAYTSKYRFVEDSIASVRLYTQGKSGTPQLLGSTHVEKDGSFYLRTPADRPLKIELLDANGHVLKREAGWFWLRKGEQRICVGCHAGPETAPENAVPSVLQRSTVAADMTATRSQTVQGGH